MTEKKSCGKILKKTAQYLIQVIIITQLWMLSEGMAFEGCQVQKDYGLDSQWQTAEISNTSSEESIELKKTLAEYNDIDSDVDETMEKLNQPLVWQNETIYLRLWGNLRNIVQYNYLNDQALLNPDNKHKVPTFNNMAQAKIKIDANMGDHIGLFIHDRVQYEISKNSEEWQTDLNNHLDQAFGSLEFGNKILTFFSIGKQRIKWGNGRLWTPVDTINPKQDLSEIEATDEGRVSYRLDIASSAVAASAVAVPNADSATFKLDNFKSTDAARLMTMKLDLFIFESDLSFYVSDKEKEDIRYGVSFATELSDIQFFVESIFWNGQSEKTYVTRISERQTFYDPVGDTQYVLPAQYTTESRNDFYYKALLGIQYTFSSDFNLIMEYYHQDDGYDNDDMENYIEFLDYTGGQYKDDVDSTIAAKNRNPQLILPDYPSQQSLLQKGASLYELARLRQNYFHFSTHWLYLLGNRYDLGLDTIINLDDLFEGRGGSFFIRPIISYTGFQDWLFSLYGQFYFGSDETEFGMTPYDWSVFFQVKYFF